jgi:outer membrane protein TolC
MKKIPLIVLIIALSAAGTSFADPHLDRILSLAARNPSILAADERISQARSDVKAAAAQQGPSLAAELSGRMNRDIPTQGREAYSASLNLVQVVYSGQTLRAGRKSAELALAASRAERDRTFQDVMNSARIEYYGLKRAASQLRVAKESLDMSNEHLRQTESMFRAGMIPRGDVLRVKVSVSQAEQDAILAAGSVEVSAAALERAIGSKPPLEEILSEIQTSNIDEIRPPEYSVYGDAPQRAFENRPEAKAYEFYRKRSEELIRAAKGERLPRVTLSAGANFAGNNYYTEDDEWYVQLALQWTLYDGGERGARVAKMESAAREMLHQIEDLNARIRHEAVQAVKRLESAQARYEVASSQIKDAQEDYRLALRRYEAQVGSNLDVLDSRSALTESLNAYVSAVYDIAAAQSELIFAIGEDKAGD